MPQFSVVFMSTIMHSETKIRIYQQVQEFVPVPVFATRDPWHHQCCQHTLQHETRTISNLNINLSHYPQPT